MTHFIMLQNIYNFLIEANNLINILLYSQKNKIGEFFPW